MVTPERANLEPPEQLSFADLETLIAAACETTELTFAKPIHTITLTMEVL